MSAPETRNWSELREHSRFEVLIDGFPYKLRDPSIVQLIARGFVPQAIVPGLGGQGRPGQEVKVAFLQDEKMQDQMILAHVIEPVLYDGPEDDPPTPDAVPLSWLGKHRDRLINAIFERLFNTEIVRGSAFRDQEGDRAPDRPSGEGEQPLDLGATQAS